MSVRVTLRPHAIASLGLPGGVLYEANERAAENCRQYAQQIIEQEGRIDTGAMLASINTRPSGTTGLHVSHSIGSDLDYARYQHDGVGPFRARPGGVLRFKPKGAAVHIFRMSSSGFSGIHFMTRALARMRPSDWA